MSNLKKTLKDDDKESDDESESEDEDDDEEERPELEAAMIRHSGCVNRIRVNLYPINLNKKNLKF